MGVVCGGHGCAFERRLTCDGWHDGCLVASRRQQAQRDEILRQRIVLAVHQVQCGSDQALPHLQQTEDTQVAEPSTPRVTHTLVKQHSMKREEDFVVQNTLAGNTQPVMTASPREVTVDAGGTLYTSRHAHT